MKKDKSRQKAEQRSAPATPEPEADSLDFSHIGPAKSPASASRSASVGTRKTTGSRDRDKADSSRRIPVAILIIVAIVLIVAFAANERSSNEPMTPAPSAAPTAPSYESPPTPESPQAYKPPRPASTPQAMNARPLPAEFLKAFQDYTAKSGGNKAIALALDSDGRSAYVSVSGYPTQAQASEEVLSECARFKIQSGVKENCRLYAEGDKVVW